MFYKASPGTPYGSISSVVSKLVAKSHMWIFSEISPELGKNKIIFEFAKPKSYLEPARALMWYQVCNSDPEREMPRNYSCSKLKNPPPLSSWILIKEMAVMHQGCSPTPKSWSIQCLLFVVAKFSAFVP